MAHPDFEELDGRNAIRYYFLERHHKCFDPDDVEFSSVKIEENELLAADIILGEYGFALDYGLRERVSRYTAATYAAWVTYMGAALRSVCNRYDDFLPMYVDFPRQVPRDTYEEWVRRVCGAYQVPGLPCLYCGYDGAMVEVLPCHHVICGHCFDMTKYRACPICQRHIDNAPAAAVRAPNAIEAGVEKRLFYGGIDAAQESCMQSQESCTYIVPRDDLYKAARIEFIQLCGATQPLHESQSEFMRHCCEAYGDDIYQWLPPTIVLRETIAVVFGALMKLGGSPDLWVLHAQRYMKTATDVLRLIAVLSGAKPTIEKVRHVRSVPNSIVKTGIFGDPEKLHYDDRTRYELYQCEEDNSLKEPELLRFYYMSSVFKPARMSRSDRRRILALLESYPEQALYDDMHRYRAVWVRLGEVLHPSEYARRYPKVERVFASLRKKLVNGASLVRRQTWQSKVEAALRDRRIDDAVSMLAERPGEFARKLSRLIAIVGENDDDNAKNVTKSNIINRIINFVKKSCDSDKYSDFIETATRVVVSVPTPLLLTLYHQLKLRESPIELRFFEPKSKDNVRYCKRDVRSPLDANMTRPIRQAILHEILARFALKRHFETCTIDSSLDAIVMPRAEARSRDTSAQLGLGSRVSFDTKPGDIVRLFLYWCQKSPDCRVDLDLSVVFFDPKWNKVGECTYFNLTCDHDGQTYAEHSGDRQDAPPPEGASEFIDIDAKVAKAAGARYVVATVLCYNGGISFDDLTAAYTGMMIRSDAKAAVYDPRTVTHRFAISGQYRGYVPIVFDLVDSEIIVADASISQRSSGNVNTLSASKELFETLANVVPYSRHLAYPSRYEIACMHAAARCERVIVRLAGGKAALYSRGAGESDVAFYRRMIERKPDSTFDAFEPSPTPPATPSLAFLLRGDMVFAQASETSIVFAERSVGSVDWALIY